MTAITSELKSHVPAVRVGLASRFSVVLKLIARTLADFNRYMDAAQQVHRDDYIR